MIAYLKNDKLRGGYYTPEIVARWLAKWAIQSPEDHVLEPSCGDGAFLAAAAQTMKEYGSPSANARLLGIEVFDQEAAKARARVADVPFATVETVDFFEWVTRNRSEKFEAVVGNPPFIRYQNFPEPCRSMAMEIMKASGLKPNKLTNIWVPFVVACIAMLREGGRLAMVLPAELLQVTYAAQLRQHLADSFRRITIYACNEMFFEGAQQEVVLLAAEGKLPAANPQNRCNISLLETKSVAELIDIQPRTVNLGKRPKVVQHDSEKWLKYFLSSREIGFMRSLREHPNVGRLGEYATVDVGVVTGKNDFFVLGSETVRAYELRNFVVPLVGRSSQLPGAVLWERELIELGKNGGKVHLLHLSPHEGKGLPPNLRKLISEGEKRGYHEGYKCRIRNPWYNVPAVWQPDCFLFRQIYDFPRAVVNCAKATSTDTIHRVRCLENPERVASNLYTHLTAASAEVEGRSYGGGVLELEPTEAERLLVPRRMNGAMPIAEVDRLVRQGQLAEVLDSNDRLVLHGSLGLSRSECTLLKSIWTKMRNRRSARKRG
jgi:adenine-specific DNA methylase